jgi:AcrR family transcriptional regulator
MDEIADEAGLRRPNLYRYFPSRDALVGAVIVREIEITNERRRARIPLAGTVGPILIQSLTLGNELARSDDLTELLLVADMRDTTSEIATSEQLVMRAEADYWKPVLGYGRGRGEINSAMTDVRIIRWFLTAQILVSTRAEMLQEVADDLRTFFAEFVVPPVLSMAGLQALLELDQSG